MNPRDTGENMERRRMIRRGGTYGPLLPEGAPDDGVDRGIAAFIGCASLVRQFEFAMNVWVNDPTFKDLENERDPIIGTQDGTFDMTIPKRPIRKKIAGLPAFTTVRGAAPTSSCPASERLAGSSPVRDARRHGGSHDTECQVRTDVQPGPSPAEVHARQTRASASIGRGAIRGKRTATSRSWTIGSPR